MQVKPNQGATIEMSHALARSLWANIKTVAHKKILSTNPSYLQPKQNCTTSDLLLKISLENKRIAKKLSV